MNNIRVSIITICLNSVKTIEDTIKSVLMQNYSNLEYIIVDGGSTDGTLDIIKKYQSGISRWISEPDKGISDAFNKGINMATGDVIGIINSDDMLAVGALDLVNQSFQTSTDILYGDAIIVRNNERSRYLALEDLSSFKYEFPLVHPSTYVRKSAYEKYGMFDLRYKYCMDYELLMRMYVKGAKFQYIHKDLAIFRLGGINEKNYIKKSSKEGFAIRIKYGVSAPCALSYRCRAVGRILLTRLIRKTPFATSIRRVIHSRRTEVEI